MQRHINIINQREAFAEDDATRIMVNEAMQDITFNFSKIGEEELKMVSGGIDVMSFRVPAKLFSDHKCVMRINSKRFVHGIMKSNDLDISRTYTLSGEYLQNKNTAVFSLVDGVTLRTIKETD